MRYGTRGYLTVGAGVAWLAALALAGREGVGTTVGSIVSWKPAATKHLVTPDQLLECGGKSDRPVEPLSSMAHDGGRFRWPSVGVARPLVMIFIKRDCPCSVEFEPLFHRLEERYRDVADFVGVIDAGVDQARAYAVANRVPYRVLADPEGAIIGRFEAKHGGYVALLGPGARIDTLWPGCSAEMMRSLGSRLAALGASPERSLDLSGAPKVLTTGCPFRL